MSRERSMTSGGLIKTGIQFSAEQLADIDRLATDRGVSRSAMARELFRLGLERYVHQQAILRAVESAGAPMLVKSA